jgi:hypothetical protein
MLVTQIEGQLKNFAILLPSGTSIEEFLDIVSGVFVLALT